MYGSESVRGKTSNERGVGTRVIPARPTSERAFKKGLLFVYGNKGTARRAMSAELEPRSYLPEPLVKELFRKRFFGGYCVCSSIWDVKIGVVIEVVIIRKQTKARHNTGGEIKQGTRWKR